MTLDKFKLTAAAVLAATVISCAPTHQEADFYAVNDGRFVRGEKPYYYIGTNFWYGPILAYNGPEGDMDRLVAELDSLKAIGIDNLRVLVGGDGQSGVPTRIEPTLQSEAGVYNEALFEGLDRFLAELGKRDMTAVLYLNNSWEWSGGYGMYLEWAGAGKAVIPAIDGWPEYMQFASGFVTNAKARELFAAHVEKVITRTNSITGVAYKDDPAIFSWQIGNEPRCFSTADSVQAAFVDWIWKTAAQIKSLDPNHMVSTGSEGLWGCENSMDLFERIHSCPDIDYLTIHIWPYNWGWINERTVADSTARAIANTDDYIDMHLAQAAKYGKPVVIEEFGYPRDGFTFAAGSPTTGRDSYYRHLFGRIISSKEEGGLLAGVNFWGWGGLAGQSADNIYWHPGDDYCGDPAQEQQGLNSVYLKDSTTVRTVREAVRELEAID